MSKITVIGNLTKDAEVKETKNGRKYVLLQVAENIRKKDENGNFVKDENGHYVSSQTFFHSIFVNDGDIAFQVQNLESGHTVKVAGIGRFNIEKGSDGYDKYILDRISATYVDTDPFKQISESDELASDEEVEAENAA